MKHTITVEEVARVGEWFRALTIASSHGAGEHKDLFVESRITNSTHIESRFAVEGHGERRYTGEYLDVAVQTYNGV